MLENSHALSNHQNYEAAKQPRWSSISHFIFHDPLFSEERPVNTNTTMPPITFTTDETQVTGIH